MISRALLTCCLLFSFAVPATANSNAADFAQRLHMNASGEELPVSDAKVVALQRRLEQLAKKTGEAPDAIAVACVRTARFLFDATKVRTNPLDLLEALEKFAPASQPVTETLHRYVAARRAAPGHAHAETMATLAGKR